MIAQAWNPVTAAGRAAADHPDCAKAFQWRPPTILTFVVEADGFPSGT
jgi:hypothetical protein